MHGRAKAAPDHRLVPRRLQFYADPFLAGAAPLFDTSLRTTMVRLLFSPI
jgi:hypothetical protein